MCELRPLLPSNQAGALQDPRGHGAPAEVLQRHEQVTQTRLFSVVLVCQSAKLAHLSLRRFQGGEQCVCGEVGVTQQYSQVRWDPFAVEVLHSLYSTAPVSMHCNQSDARSFPVSPPQANQFKPTGQEALLKWDECIYLVSSNCLLLPRETGTSSRCQWSPPPSANRTTPVRPEAPPAEPLSLPPSEGTLVTFPFFSQDKCPVTSKQIVCAY